MTHLSIEICRGRAGAAWEEFSGLSELPPEDVLQELVRYFVVEVVRSWVCHLCSLLCAEEFLDHPES